MEVRKTKSTVIVVKQPFTKGKPILNKNNKLDTKRLILESFNKKILCRPTVCLYLFFPF